VSCRKCGGRKFLMTSVPCDKCAPLAKMDSEVRKEWTDLKRPKTFEDAVALFDFIKERGEDPHWSLQYYGFGEHLTFWAGYGGFWDFDVDNGTAFNWVRMKEIIIESAQDMYDNLREHRANLFENTDILRKDEKMCRGDWTKNEDGRCDTCKFVDEFEVKKNGGKGQQNGI
jgi:hypothetical protein